MKNIQKKWILFLTSQEKSVIILSRKVKQNEVIGGKKWLKDMIIMKR